jgi:uncharacterized protein (DUF427 family)
MLAHNINGACIADSERALVIHERRLPPAYYLPAEDGEHELFTLPDDRELE